jgi:hypothetical protein
MTIAARMNKTIRAHISGLYFLEGLFLVGLKGLDIETPPGTPVDDLLRCRELLSR